MDPSPSGPRGRVEPAPLKRGPGVLARPWFWLLVIGGLWAVPLVKSLTAELPPPLPGIDEAPLELALPADDGRAVTLTDLAGHLVVLRAFPLADEGRVDQELGRLHELRGRLRGLGSAVVFVLVTSGASRAELVALLDERNARKPTQLFLHDESGAAWERLLAAARVDDVVPPPDALLLDRHARVRGVYGADRRAVDRLVREAGQLANWPGSDPSPTAPSR